MLQIPAALRYRTLQASESVSSICQARLDDARLYFQRCSLTDSCRKHTIGSETTGNKGVTYLIRFCGLDPQPEARAQGLHCTQAYPTTLLQLFTFERSVIACCIRLLCRNHGPKLRHGCQIWILDTAHARLPCSISASSEA